MCTWVGHIAIAATSKNVKGARSPLIRRRLDHIAMVRDRLILLIITDQRRGKKGARSPLIRRGLGHMSITVKGRIAMAVVLLANRTITPTHQKSKRNATPRRATREE